MHVCVLYVFVSFIVVYVCLCLCVCVCVMFCLFVDFFVKDMEEKVYTLFVVVVVVADCYFVDCVTV